jgi:hypothetical protein
MLSQTGCLTLLLLLSSATAFCQNADREACSFLASSNKEEITLRGKIGDGPHDMLLIVPHCDDAIVLIYAGDSEADVPAARLVANQNLKKVPEVHRIDL